MFLVSSNMFFISNNMFFISPIIRGMSHTVCVLQDTSVKGFFIHMY